MTGDQWQDDDRLFAELGDAVRSRQTVPRRFVDVGKAAFAWHGIDFELATLSYDSAVSGLPGGVRADTPTTRALTFVAGDLTIELELSPDALAGQVVPPTPGSAEVRFPGADVPAVTVDDTGWFEVRPAVGQPFRLCVRTEDGRVVLTETITP